MLIGKFELIQKKQAGAGGALFSPLDMVIGVIIVVAGLTAILLRIFVFRSKPPRVVRPS